MKIFQFLFLGNFSITNAQSVNLFTQNRKPNPEKTIVANDELKTIGLNTPPDTFSFNGRESFEDFEKIIQQFPLRNDPKSQEIRKSGIFNHISRNPGKLSLKSAREMTIVGFKNVNFCKMSRKFSKLFDDFLLKY